MIRVIRIYADGKVEKVEHWAGGKHEVLHVTCERCGTHLRERYFTAHYASDGEPDDTNSNATVVLLERKGLIE